MSGWVIEYWSEKESKSPIEKWLQKLDTTHVKGMYTIIGFLKRLGNELEVPYSKALGKGIFELREQKYGYRIYYGFNGKCVIILLAAGNKTSQDNDIKIARKRMSQIQKMKHD